MKIKTEVIPGARLQVGEHSYLYFGGTSYLGIQTHPQFRELLAENTLKIGSHWGASRAGNLVLSVYEATEKELAAWLGSEACLTLSSGFMAARLLVEYFKLQGHPCFFSPNCHEALLPADGQRAPDWEELRKTLTDIPIKKGGVAPVVFTDTVGTGNRPGPVWDILKSLPKACILVADDSHGLGICGEDGSGSWKNLSNAGFGDLLLCSSLGKAMGITAGMVSGPTRILNRLKETAFFEGASPAPPAGLASLADGLNKGLYLQQYRRLLENVDYFNQKVGPLKIFQSHPGYPVFYFTDPDLALYLLEHRVLITDFKYAAEAGDSSPKRIVISAVHEKIHLDQLIALLEAYA